MVGMLSLCTVADVGHGRDGCRATNIGYNRFSTNSTISAEVKVLRVLRRPHTPSTFKTRRFLLDLDSKNDSGSM